MAAIAAVAFLLAALFYFGERQGRAMVKISVEGEVYKTLSLDAEEEVIIEHQGHRNVVRISGGEVQMLQASCPDGLCIRQGKIRVAPQSIICLPNKVVVEIIGESAYDGIGG